jgi:transposase
LLTDGERERIARSRSAFHGLVRRAKIILASADGESKTAVARRLGIANPTVWHWRNKWFDQGIAGLYGEARPGRPRTHDEVAVANLLRTVLKTKPSAGTHWTVRSAAQATGLSKSTVDDPLAPAELGDAVLAAQSFQRILSSAEKCRRVARRMALIASSAGCFSGRPICLMSADGGHDSATPQAHRQLDVHNRESSRQNGPRLPRASHNS